MKLSIIVPAYNASKTIIRCLESIVHAHSHNSEVIIINDGSTDDTLEVVNNFKYDSTGVDLYPFIRIINQENQGLAVVRNVGFDESTGDYLTCVDSDDFLTEEGLNPLLEAAEKHNMPDWVLGGSKHIRANGMVDIYLPEKELYYDGENCPKFIYSHIPPAFWSSTWGKIYKRSTLIKNRVYNTPGMVRGQDVEFNSRYLLNVKSVLLVPAITYVYFLGLEGSATAKFFGQRHIDAFTKLGETKRSTFKELYKDDINNEQYKTLEEFQSYGWLTVIYCLYRSNTQKKYSWLKKICIAAEQDSPKWTARLVGRAPRIFAKLLKTGYLLPHLSLIFASKIPSLNKKLLG